MKKTYSLLLLLLGGSLLTLITSLAGCVQQHYKFIFKSGIVSLVEGNANSFVQVSDTCSYNKLFIRDSLQFEIITAGIPINFGNKIYAQKADDDYTPLEDISDIKVYTVNDYNSNYPAGSDISAILTFYSFNIGNSAEIPKSQVLESLNSVYFSLAPFRGIAMGIGEPPAQASSQQFIVELRTEVNAVIRSKSASVVVIP